MKEIGDRITFAQLLKRHQRIEIPLIQRDYAQGRLTEEQIREEFIGALQGALEREPDDELLPLNLDFVYGSVEGNRTTRFFPLDGQQRLTTLFLLHWYLASKDDRLDEFRELFSLPGPKSRFSYHVRPSSEDFFNALVAFSPNSALATVRSIKAIIIDQPWYFSNWRLDPTIQSSLTMLDTIHNRFAKCDGLFCRLVDVEFPAITFQLLELENFGLSDDLYIKMNARGKPLTAFENFKARYEALLEQLFPEETRTIGGQPVSLAEYFSRQMDTQWADFFWSRRGGSTNLYDEAVMNLFRSVALVTRDTESDTYLADVESLRNMFLEPTYSVFRKGNWLDKRFSEMLILVLDTWTDGDNEFETQLPDAKYFDEVKLFEKAVRDPTGLNYVEIVQFAAYCVFLREHVDDIDSNAFQEWMRVIFNLSTNTSYDRAADLQRSMSAIGDLVENSGNILNYFATAEKPVTGFNEQQILEEKLKAELICKDANWRPLVEQAETHKYFRGQIEFLLEFCGALDTWRESGNVDWAATAHLSFQKQFQAYLSKAMLMFNARGLVDLGLHRWERALLGIGNYLLPRGTHNISFLANPATDQASWKRLLRGAWPREQKARRLLRKLWNRLEMDRDVSSQLDTFIENACSLEPWRQAFVDTPRAIEYCETRCIRWLSKDEIYLLKRIQMNGTHAELFTFCLYHNELQTLNSYGDLAPLQLQGYVNVFGTDFKPGAQFKWSHDGHDVVFDLKRWEDCFSIFVRLDSLAHLSAVKCLLRDVAGFEEREDKLQREISPADIQSPLRELADVLAGIPGKDNCDDSTT